MTTATRGWSEQNVSPRSSSLYESIADLSPRLPQRYFRTGEGTAFDFCRFRTFSSERANPRRRHLLEDRLRHAYTPTLFCGRKRTLVRRRPLYFGRSGWICQPHVGETLEAFGPDIKVWSSGASFVRIAHRARTRDLSEASGSRTLVGGYLRLKSYTWNRLWWGVFSIGDARERRADFVAALETNHAPAHRRRRTGNRSGD